MHQRGLVSYFFSYPHMIYSNPAETLHWYFLLVQWWCIFFHPWNESWQQIIFPVQAVLLLCSAALWTEVTADNALPGHQALYWILFAFSSFVLDSWAEKVAKGRLILAPRWIEEPYWINGLVAKKPSLIPEALENVQLWCTKMLATPQDY